MLVQTSNSSVSFRIADGFSKFLAKFFFEESVMECPICFREGGLIAAQPCEHAFCEACIVRHCETSDRVTCPLCRGALVGLPRDLRADCTVELPWRSYAGVTLANAEGGVVVRALHRRDRCKWHGLKVGDCLEAINGIPCVDHHKAIGVVDACTALHVPMVCTLRLPRKRSWRLVSVFYR